MLIFGILLILLAVGYFLLKRKNPITTTTTTTAANSTTTTTSSETMYYYYVDIYNCGSCVKESNASAYSNHPLTIGSYYGKYEYFSYLVTEFIGNVPITSYNDLSNASEYNDCSIVPCDPPTTTVAPNTTTTTTLTETMYYYNVSYYNCPDCIYESGAGWKSSTPKIVGNYYDNGDPWFYHIDSVEIPNPTPLDMTSFVDIGVDCCPKPKITT